MPATAVPRCRPDLVDGAGIAFAGGVIPVHHVPGHSPGQVMFVLPSPGPGRPACAIVGDCLFAGSIGRTDFPGGDYELLLSMVREKIFPLGDEVKVTGTVTARFGRNRVARLVGSYVEAENDEVGFQIVGGHLVRSQSQESEVPPSPPSSPWPGRSGRLRRASGQGNGLGLGKSDHL